MQKNMANVLFVYLSWTLLLVIDCHGNRVIPSCGPDEPVCQISLQIAHNLTMMYFPRGDEGPMMPVTVLPNGTFLARSVTCDGYVTIPDHVTKDVVIGDGFHKRVILVNGKLPAPPIVVWEKQDLEVNVTNGMLNEAITIHWHGMEMTLTPWADGVPSVNQCPINIGETFTYRFRAENPGTHWYHGHLGTQRTTGLAGPLIVLPRTREIEQERRADDPLPDFDAEFYLMVQDWMDMQPERVYDLVRHLGAGFSYGFDSEKCFSASKQVDGVDCSVIPFVSGVINGKGRHYPESASTPLNKGIPLERFVVKKGKRYRFRVICSSMTFAFRLSVHGHVMNVIATEGNDLRTRLAQSIIINSGERYDFWIEATDPDNTGLYWIQAETLERTREGKPIHPGHVEAILQYEGTPLADPTSSVSCTPDDPCEILNCPYRFYPPKEYKVCLPVTELRTPLMQPTHPATPGGLSEFILNFDYTGFKTSGVLTAVVNGIRQMMPTTPPNIQPIQNYIPCPSGGCHDEICRCTHILKVPLGNIVQFTFATTILNKDLLANPHPIHIHGYGYQVLKIGYPIYDEVTGRLLRETEDLSCSGPNCNVLVWTNSSWANGNIPDVISAGAPIKDTVIYPAGGYTVVRFHADNPGFWYMHCHVEFHNENGMGIIIQVGEPEEMKKPPKHMNTCGDTSWSYEEYLQLISSNKGIQKELSVIDDPETQEASMMQYTVVGLGVLVILLVIILAVVYAKFNHRPTSSQRIPMYSSLDPRNYSSR